MRFKNILLGSVLALAMAGGVATSVSAAGDELPQTITYEDPKGMWRTVKKPYFDSRGILQYETCMKSYVWGSITCTNTELPRFYYNSPQYISKYREFPSM